MRTDDQPHRILLNTQYWWPGLAAGLGQAGFIVRETTAQDDVEEAARVFRPDIAVLVGAGPNGDGVERRLRQDHGLPVVAVREPDDGSVPHPDTLAERIRTEWDKRAVRSDGGRAGKLAAADIVVDLGAHVVIRGEHAVELTPREFDLLVVLIENRNTVLSKSALLGLAWGYTALTPNTVEVHISSLRRKLELHGDRVLHTVRGVGYVLRVPAVSPYAEQRRALLRRREELRQERLALRARRATA